MGRPRKNNRSRDLVYELSETIDSFSWSEWERDFIDSIKGREMDYLSARQQEKVFQLIEKMDSLQ